MSDLLEFFNAYRVPAQHATSFLLAGLIWRWGGAPERWLIGIFLATMVLPIYVVWWLDPARSEAGPYKVAYMVIDIVAAVAFVWIALKANRNYPLWIAGFQLVALGAHLVKALVDSVSPLAFAILVVGPSYFQLLLILGGFVRHVLRERRFGPYRPWRLSAPASGRLRL